MYNPYNIVKEFENTIAEYTSAPYAVAVDSCTNAIFLCCRYLFGDPKGWKYRMAQEEYFVPPFVSLPKRTYVGVAHAVFDAGANIIWEDNKWEGWYQLKWYNLWDSARRFYRGMFEDVKDNSFVCLSFHTFKHIPIGRGGMILTDDKKAVEWLKRVRYDGRNMNVAPKDDIFDTEGYHMLMRPDDAARGLMLMQNVKDYYEDLPWDDYPDLEKQFRRKGE